MGLAQHIFQETKALLAVLGILLVDAAGSVLILPCAMKFWQLSRATPMALFLADPALQGASAVGVRAMMLVQKILLQLG